MTIELPLYMQDGAYPARLDRFLISRLWDEGVATPRACKVTQRAAGANFTVDIAVGDFIIAGDDQSLQGSYQGRITATESVTIGAAPSGSNKRIDLVTLRINDPNAGGNAGNNATPIVVPGTQTTGTPVAPPLPGSSIPLATVGPITSGTASITNSIITDGRLFAGPKAPVGELRLMAIGAPSINGWLYCDGRAVSLTTYADLYAWAGTTFGAGDGSTTFNIPDLRDRVPLPYGTLGALGATGGEINHTLTTAEMPVHAHGVTDPGHAHAESTAGGLVDGTSIQPFGAAAGSARWTTTIGATTGGSFTSIAVNNAGSGGSHNNLQPYQVVSGWMIRT